MATYENALAPTRAQLGKATALALGAAALILVGAVLPAEYGIDPTGIGKALGLTRLNNPDAEAGADLAPAAAAGAARAVVTKSSIAMRSDTMELTLQPGEGAEIKARMRQGDEFVFSWDSADAEVKSDMHGEPLNAKESEFTSYWKERRQRVGQGSFVAPFEGTHGWYWRNPGEKPVTVKVRVSGFYEKLYRPS